MRMHPLFSKLDHSYSAKCHYPQLSLAHIPEHVTSLTEQFKLFVASPTS